MYPTGGADNAGHPRGSAATASAGSTCSAELVLPFLERNNLSLRAHDLSGVCCLNIHSLSCVNQVLPKMLLVHSHHA